MNGTTNRSSLDQVTMASYSKENLPDPFRWQVISALRMMWPEDFVDYDLFPSTIFRPEWLSTHIVVSAADVVIAHAGIVFLDANHSGAQYRVAGVGAVVTFPNFRKMGFGRRAVVEATRIIDESDADIAALFCPFKLVGFYRRLGWSIQVEGLTTIGDPASPQIESEPRLMRFISEHGRSGQETFSTSKWHLNSRW